MADIQIESTTLDILKNLVWSGTEQAPLAVIPEQLPPELYQKVDQVLKNLGGKWKTKKGHQFDDRGKDNVKSAIETGIAPDFKKRLQAFYTPKAVAELLFEGRCLKDYEILEPEAGGGMLARMARDAGANVTCIEIDPYEANRLSREFPTTCGDFLEMVPDPKYNCVFMNPPFNKGMDLKHVRHALKFLQTPGSLHAIISPNPDPQQLQAIASEYGLDQVEIEYVDEGAFKESGTNIQTKILRIHNNINKHNENTLEWLKTTINMELSHGQEAVEINHIVETDNKTDMPFHCRKKARTYMQANFPNDSTHNAEKTINLFLSPDQRLELEQSAYELLREITMEYMQYNNQSIPEVWKEELHKEESNKTLIRTEPTVKKDVETTNPQKSTLVSEKRVQGDLFAA